MKKNNKLLLIFSIAFVCLLLFTSCKKTYEVSFIVDDKIIEIQTINKGAKASLVEAPNVENYIFLGWYNEDDVFDFETVIAKDYKLTAKYVIKCAKEDHQWIDATCTTPKTCSVCHETLGESLGHKYDSDCDTTCNVCLHERVTSVQHEFADATHESPATCKHCGETTGEKIPYASQIITDNLDISVYIGQTVQFTATVFPSNAPQEVGYRLSLSEDAEATIDENGLLTTIQPGYAYVTIYSKDVTYVTKTITVTMLHPLLEEEVYDAFNIMTGLGADSSKQIEINYHTHNTRTYVEYTLATDVDFNNYSTVSGSGYYFTNGTDKVIAEFEPRNVYRVSISDLKPNTEYIYRINKGNDTYSEVYHFKTASNDGGSTSFFVMSDTHYSTKLSDDGTYISHGSEISEEIINNALQIDPNISFIASAGDAVDKGGDANIWDIFFKESVSLKSLPRIGVAGNHEYYINGTTQSDGRYQKAHYATPYNGPSKQLGLSCYYIYNNILFVVIDNEKTIGRTEMLSWLEDVLANTEYMYSFVMMHTPVYYENDESSNKDRDEELLEIFEKFSVDLVLAGHYHGDRMKTNYYQGSISTDEGLGVNYMTLSFSGIKSASDSNPATGYIINTDNGVITITRISDTGKIISVRTITTKRNKEVISESKENLIKSININYDETEETCVINLSDRFYGNVKKVIVQETLRSKLNKTVYFPTPSYNKIILKVSKNEISKYYDHHFSVTIEFVDGTQEVLEYNLDLSKKLNSTVSDVTNSSALIKFDASDESLDYIIKNYVIYVNGEQYDTIDYLEYDKPITSYFINNLSSNTKYEIKFVANNYRNQQVYSFSIEFITLQ